MSTSTTPVDSQRSELGPQATNQQIKESRKPGSKNAQSSGRAGQRQSEASLPAKSAVSRLLIHIKVLMDSLSEWSRGNLSKVGVSDAYVRLDNELNAVMALFQATGVNTRQMASASSSLRPALETLLDEEATPEILDRHFFHIRPIIMELLQVLASNHTEYEKQVAGASESPRDTGSDVTEQKASVQRTNTGQIDGASGQGGSGSVVPYTVPFTDRHVGLRLLQPVPDVDTAVTRLLIATEDLLESLTRWSKSELTKEDVSEAYVRMGNDFDAAVAAFQANGIDMSPLLPVPNILRRCLEEALAEEATPENLEIYLPNIRNIVRGFQTGLRVKQYAYGFKLLASSKISSREPGVHPSPRRSGEVNQLAQGSYSAAASPGASPVPKRENATLANAALVLDYSPEHLHQPGTPDEHAAALLQVEQEPQPVPQSTYEPDDPSKSSPHNGNSHTRFDKVSPLVDLPSVAPNESKVVHQILITRNMSIVEILEHLCRHGCNDVSSLLDTSKYSEYPISSGGYGEVYRGALHDGSAVAIKCLKLPLNERAAHEIYVWSKCIHPNILGLTGVTQYRNQLAMVSSWMPYGSLRCLLSLEPGVDRYNLCAQIVDGIAYLHQAGVVHGDLKGVGFPLFSFYQKSLAHDSKDNILFSADLTPKLADFGNATLKEYTLQFSQTTGRVGMSLNWVAPEVLKGETGLTPEGDIWSLGMTMLEAMTGEPPYAGIRKFSVMRRIESKILPVRPEAHVPSHKTYADLIWSLFKECWTYHPPQRPSAVEVQHKMKGVISERDLQLLNSGARQQL